ncbi:hypothetical protein [Massilia sp. HP4]|uniref:hypothetical protein n=1 Tax=Massilia sp. HP4 TaxID=2562316 RepID=UPI001485B3D5|nr:hypothetical protein [Massilia sp. HP4]
MIRNISIRLLGIFFLVLMAGTVFGWLMVEDFAGEKVGKIFLGSGLSIALLIFSIQSALFFWAGSRLYRQLIFLTAGVFSITWFMFCFFVPLLLTDYIRIEIRVVMVVALLYLSASNVLEAHRKFSQKWKNLEKLDRYIKREDDVGKGFIDWDRLIKSMDLSIEIYIPGVPSNIAAAISVAMVIFMLLGFFLKSIFPMFSAFAWGIPSASIVAYFFQVVGYNAAQAMKVKSLERKFNMKFRSNIEPSRRRRISRGG